MNKLKEILIKSIILSSIAMPINEEPKFVNKNSRRQAKKKNKKRRSKIQK
jgi:hypothetical protein